MADVFKVLAQHAMAAANTEETVYTVPSSTSTTISTVTICNGYTSSIKVRLLVAVAGAALDPKQYLYYDSVIPANTTLTLTAGITMATTDVLKIRSDTYNVSYPIAVNVFGVEVT